MLWIFIITAYYYYYCYHHRESCSRYNNKIQKMNKETAVCSDATTISNRFCVRSQRDESFALEIRTFIAQALSSSVQLYVQLTVWSLRLLTLCAVQRYADWSIILCALQMIRCTTIHWCVTVRPCGEENIIIASNGCRWMGICLQKKFIYAFKRNKIRSPCFSMAHEQSSVLSLQLIDIHATWQFCSRFPSPRRANTTPRHSPNGWTMPYTKSEKWPSGVW